MRTQAALKGIAFLAGVVLLGAGCSGSGSVQTPPAGGTTGGSAGIYLEGEAPDSNLPNGAPVEGYEPGLSDPSQR